MVGGCAAVRLSNSLRSAAARVSSAAKTSSFRFSATKPLSHRIFRSPIELSSCLQTVQPFHTVNASALMSSTFVFTRRSYGWLPEVMANGGVEVLCCISCCATCLYVHEDIILQLSCINSSNKFPKKNKQKGGIM